MKRLKYVAVLVSGLALLWGSLFIRDAAERDIAAVDATSQARFRQIVILDAGHGGEDGGAVASDGTLEKDLNLSISNRISCFFSLFGIPFIETRTRDDSVGDPSLKSIRERKRSDIRSRFSLVESTENSVLLSIHQNYYTDPRFSGTQVFFAKHIPEAEALAHQIQNAVVSMIQPENRREIKGSDDHIYLLYHAKRPSVMVECGFISNPDELKLLKDAAYQSRLSYAITRGVLSYFTS